MVSTTVGTTFRHLADSLECQSRLPRLPSNPSSLSFLSWTACWFSGSRLTLYVVVVVDVFASEFDTL